ncbi:unnamed protein product [Prunus armeniaca]|uniref:Uncharacterized protein n=1 Tax=Prunus armeniaca TaxID=36596 RepID=A0A6J5XUL9_PRUAR|nr:unnamed protein product [Prunus armeniaca]
MVVQPTHKFDPRAQRCIFVGYPIGQKVLCSPTFHLLAVTTDHWAQHTQPTEPSLPDAPPAASPRDPVPDKPANLDNLIRPSLRPKQPLVWHKDYHMSNQVSHSTSVLCSASARGLLGAHWLQSHGNSEVKRVRAKAITGWVTHREVACEFTETKPNKTVRAEMRAQSEQYRAMAEPIPGCDSQTHQPLLSANCCYYLSLVQNVFLHGNLLEVV